MLQQTILSQRRLSKNMENDVVVSVSHVSKNFDRLKVLNDISLELKRGKITCVLGGSGCGKTTLLKIIAGLEKATKGDIITDLQLPGKTVGYMSQEDSLLPWKTAEQNVSFAMELTGAKNHRQAMKMLKLVKLARFFRFYPKQLSGGQRQRVSLARMLAVSPQLLLLDEPLSALDLVVKNDLVKVIRNYVQEKNATALMITHSVEEAIAIADQILILSTRPAIITAKIDVSDIRRNELFSSVKKQLEEAILEKKCETSY